jgi:hypothetical protein
MYNMDIACQLKDTKPNVREVNLNKKKFGIRKSELGITAVSNCVLRSVFHYPRVAKYRRESESSLWIILQEL